MMRHGSTCANLARALDNHLDSNLYTDPELTTEGRRLARALRPYAQKAFQKPLVVGASPLLRTQQTAHLVLNPKKILIIPHSGEMGRESHESTALAPDLQTSVLSERLGDKKVADLRDYSMMRDNPAVAEEDQQAAFLQWIGGHLPALTDQGRKSLVLISHYGVLHGLLKTATGQTVDTIRNCDLFRLTVDIRGGKAVLKKMEKVEYAPSELLNWNLKRQKKRHGCRLPIEKTRRA
jgi:broad specificity phosphatase PhoE